MKNNNTYLRKFVLPAWIAVLLFISQTAKAQPFCDTVWGGVGFPFDTGCQAAVCAVDPFCCSIFWDGICATANPTGADWQAACCGCVQTQNPAVCTVAAPPNDLCANADPILCNTTISGTTTNATFDGAPFCGTSNTAPGVWYFWTGDGTDVTLTTCGAGTNYDTKLTVYSGTCGALTCVDGNDDDFGCGFSIFHSTVTFPSVPGTDYWILVHGFGSATGNFDLTMTCVPPNDLCANAEPINCGDTVGGITSGASFDGAPFCGTSNTAPGVWYSWTGDGSLVDFTTCSPNTNYDTKLTVYEGTCAGLVCVDGNDDDFSCANSILHSRVSFCSTPGTNYLILVHGFGSATGNFDLTLTCTPAAISITCPPDQTLDCTQAIPPGVATEAGFLAAGGTITSVCPVTSVTFSDVTTITNCGIIVQRTYTVSAGLESATCVQTLQTLDTTPPVVSCPPGQTLTCFENVPSPFTNAVDFIAGGGTISDDCTFNLADFSVFSQQSDNGGTNCPGDPQIVTRTYYITDLCGNLTTCTQVFTYLTSTQGPVITSVLPACYKYCGELVNPSEDDITFDSDCSFGTTVTITGPTIIGPENCPGTIYRFTYSVTDDCGRTSAPATRDFIIGNEGPTITCAPFNLILECGDPSNADYVATHLGNVSANTSCELGVNIANNYFGNPNSTSCVTTNVVTFTATDDCGRIATCTTTITILDTTPPTLTSTYEDGVCNEAICGSNVQFWFNNWKSKVLEGLSATDNCDSFVSISAVGPSSPNQDCPNGTSETVVTWVAVDNCGNESEISYSFYVVPAQVNAPPMAQGVINTEEAEAVQDVEVTLEGNGGFFAVFETLNDGIYGFSNLMEGQNYSITPYLDDNALNGVSSYDMVLIAQHILNVNLLDSPYKLIAADVNNSGTVTTADILALRKVLLYIEESFQDNTSWRFVEADFIFPDATNPWASVFPELANINGLIAGEEHDFIGIKVGDVNNTAVPNDLVSADDRSFVGNLPFYVQDQSLDKGALHTVTFRAGDFEAVHGYQFTLDFDRSVLEFVEVLPGELVNMNATNFGLALLDEGVITTSWTNQEGVTVAPDTKLFEVTFRAKAAAQLSDLLAVSSRYTVAEAYNGNLELMGVDLRFDTDEDVADQLRLYQNTPNPFNQETVIGFDLPKASTATLNIFNASGRLLQQVEGSFEKGYNTIVVSDDALTPGILYYQLVTPTHSATKKMILSR